MKLRKITLVLAASALLFAQADTALQKAIRKETVEGDLKGAIEQYNKLAKSRDRVVAAKALVRMGECYEKLGDAQARATYERAIKDFGDQKDAVATARARLTALDAGKSDPGVVERMVAQRLGGRIYGSAISRDGRYAAFRNNVGAAGLHDLVSGEVRVLRQQPTLGNYPPLISPDGKVVAVAVSDSETSVRIHLLGTDQTSDRILATPKSAVPVNWSADGGSLVAYQLGDEGITDAKIAIVSVADGTTKVVGPAAPFQVSGGVGFPPRLSPDGRYVVFGKFGGRAAPDANIYIRPVDGGPESVLAEDVASGLSTAAWTPDGSRLVFTSDHGGGGNELWSLLVQDGKAMGRPVLVKQGVGNLLGVTQNGEYYYQLRINTQDVYVAGVDLRTGRFTDAPKADTKVTGELYPSPDGQYRAYVDGRSVAIGSTGPGPERKFPLERIVVNMQWFPDSKSLLWHAANDMLFQLDPRTGDSQRLLNSEVIAVYLDGGGTYQPTVVLAPDGRRIYYLVRYQSGPQTGIMSRDLTSGAKQEIGRISADVIGGLSLSPDGSRFAYLTPGPAATGQNPTWSLMTMAANGGEPKLVLSQAGMAPAPAGVAGTGAAWSADGRRLFFIKHGQPDDVFVVSADGGAPQALGIALHNLSALRMHPNGKQISFVDSQSDNQLWVVKNLFGDAKK